MHAARRLRWLPACAAGILALVSLMGCGSAAKESPIVVLFSDVGAEARAALRRPVARHPDVLDFSSVGPTDQRLLLYPPPKP